MNKYKNCRLGFPVKNNSYYLKTETGRQVSNINRSLKGKAKGRSSFGQNMKCLIPRRPYKAAQVCTAHLNINPID